MSWRGRVRSCAGRVARRLQGLQQACQQLQQAVQHGGGGRPTQRLVAQHRQQHKHPARWTGEDARFTILNKKRFLKEKFLRRNQKSTKKKKRSRHLVQEKNFDKK